MLVTLELLKQICNEAKAQSKRIVFTNGCFDILHSGHCKYLNEAKKLGDILIVGLNSDSSIKQIKGEDRPINNETDRAYVLSSLRAVDYVILFEEDTPYNLISALLPNILVKGKDYEIKNIVGADIVFANGGNVETIDLVPGKSSTNVIDKLKKTKK